MSSLMGLSDIIAVQTPLQYKIKRPSFDFFEKITYFCGKMSIMFDKKNFTEEFEGSAEDV